MFFLLKIHNSNTMQCKQISKLDVHSWSWIPSVLNTNSWAVAPICNIQKNHEKWMLQLLPMDHWRPRCLRGACAWTRELQPGQTKRNNSHVTTSYMYWCTFTIHLQKALEIDFRLGHIGMCKPFGALFAILQVFLRTHAYIPWNQLVQNRDKSQQRALLSGSTWYLGTVPGK